MSAEWLGEPLGMSSWMKMEGGQLADRWFPVFIDRSKEYLGSFTNGMQSVELYPNLYDFESQDKERVGCASGWYDKEIWRLNHRETIKVDEGGSPRHWRKLHIQSGRRSRVVIASYIISERLFADETAAKIAGLFNRIKGPTMSGAIAALAECV